MMTRKENVTVLGLIKTLRRTIRVLARLEETAIEDDLKKKYGQFAEEHRQLLNFLKKMEEFNIDNTANTPTSMIQFPIEREELLKIAAKMEKQAVLEIEQVIDADVKPKITETLKKHKSSIVASYDYIQALHDLLL